MALSRSSTPPTPPAPPPPPTMGARLKRTLFRTILFLIIGVPILVLIYIWVMFSYSYSKGERVGYIQKFSNKGWVCKTWEGELAMANLPGAMPQIFEFTVRDPQTAARINDSLGKRVRIHYEQHLGLPTTCFGDTTYFVNGVHMVDDDLPQPR